MFWLSEANDALTFLKLKKHLFLLPFNFGDRHIANVVFILNYRLDWSILSLSFSANWLYSSKNLKSTLMACISLVSTSLHSLATTVLTTFNKNKKKYHWKIQFGKQIIYFFYGLASVIRCYIFIPNMPSGLIILTWWNNNPMILKNRCRVSTTTNSKGMPSSGGFLYPFLSAVEWCLQSSLHSRRLLSIGHSSTEIQCKVLNLKGCTDYKKEQKKGMKVRYQMKCLHLICVLNIDHCSKV